MCGIAGFYESDASPDDRRASLRQALGSIRHRGPDGEGVWIDPASPLSIGHRRLAIVELSDLGAQPMASQDGRWTLAFNGEIYNFLDLRGRLESQGVRFRGGSDTEALLELIAREGFESAVRASVGMFAIAAWDRRERTLWLARDRMGEKPLYYGRVDSGAGPGRVFGFASEARALRAHPRFGRAVSREAAGSMLRFGYVPDPLSIFEGVRKLPPGSFLALDERALSTGEAPEPKPYWSLIDAIAAGKSSGAASGRAPAFRDDRDWIDELDRALGEAVALQMRADVPLGAFLSGGVDSTTVVALMQERSSRPVRTFTIGFEGALYDESPFARAIARRLGTEHEELVATEAEAQALAPEMPRAYDEPFADSSQIPTYMVSKLARSRVTVSLSGDGGDELFGGYNRYVLGDRVWRRASRLPAPVRAGAAALLRTVPSSFVERAASAAGPLIPRRLRFGSVADRWEKLASVLSSASPERVYETFVAQWADPSLALNDGAKALATTARGAASSSFAALAVRSQAAAGGAIGGLSFIEAMMAQDGLTYLPGDVLTKVDRAGMAWSLESRMPLLDHRVVELAWRIPERLKVREGRGKWILRQVLGRRVPLEEMERPKAGFSVPLGTWLRGPLREWAEDSLSESALAKHGILSAPAVQAAWREHLSGRRDRQKEAWSALMLQGWLDENAKGARA